MPRSNHPFKNKLWLFRFPYAYQFKTLNKSLEEGFSLLTAGRLQLWVTPKSLGRKSIFHPMQAIFKILSVKPMLGFS